MKKNFWQIAVLLFIFISLLAYLFAPKSIKKMLLRSRAYTNELNIRIKLQGEYDKIDNPSFNTKVVLYNQTGKVKEYTNQTLAKKNENIFNVTIDTTGLEFNTTYAIFVKPDKYLGKLFCSSTAYSENCTTPQITISSGSNTLYLTQSLFLSGDISTQDGKITAEDISKILKQIGQVTTDYLSGDINSDKKVEGVDYSLALYSLSKNAVDDPITIVFTTTTPTPTPTTGQSPTNTPTPTKTPTPTPNVASPRLGIDLPATLSLAKYHFPPSGWRKPLWEY